MLSSRNSTIDAVKMLIVAELAQMAQISQLRARFAVCSYGVRAVSDTLSETLRSLTYFVSLQHRRCNSDLESNARATGLQLRHLER
jgi:hypothetical protein